VVHGSRSNANVIRQGQRSRSSMGPTRPILLMWMDAAVTHLNIL